MGIITQISQLLLSLSILVLLHEAGHFFFAKLFRTRVEKFYLFFNPWFSLFKFRKGDTEYGIGWLPLGGYCKIAGMIDESMDKEQLMQPAQPWEFRSKPAWKRLLIISGGVFVNFVLALVIYSMVLFIWGQEYLPVKNAKFGVEWNDIALNIGLKNGDKIIRIDTAQVEKFGEIPSHIVIDKAKTITVERNGEIKTIDIPEDFASKIISNRIKNLVVPVVPFVIDKVMNNMPASKSHLLEGDSIVGINNISTTSFFAFQKEIQNFKGKEIELKIFRGAEEKNIKVEVTDKGLIGVRPKPWDYFFKLKTIHYGFFASIPAGISAGVTTLTEYVKQLPLIFTKAGAQQLGGFGTIGSMFPKEWDWESFWTMTALLSIILAFMNILPIPALDGGFIMFILFEIITGKKPSDKFLEYAQIVGMILLLSLLLFANGNDLMRWLK